MIEVRELRKLYGELVAVESVSFTVEPGMIFGLLGPNGAGKSTAIGCISGLLRPSGGKASVLGHDVVTDRGREPVKKFSGGMKRRLNFACGIVHQPRVLLLDEPTVGVDPHRRPGRTHVPLSVEGSAGS